MSGSRGTGAIYPGGARAPSLFECGGRNGHRGGAGETEISCNDVMDFTEYVTH